MNQHIALPPADFATPAHALADALPVQAPRKQPEGAPAVLPLEPEPSDDDYWDNVPV